MESRVCYLAPIIVLTAGLSLARGQTVETDPAQAPWWLRVVTEAPLTMPLSRRAEIRASALVDYPSSGVLPAPPSVTVPFPPSGVLEPPQQRQTITIIPIKTRPLESGANAPTTTAPAGRRQRIVARGRESQKREHPDHGVASAATAREMKNTRIFAVAGDRQAPVLHSRW